MMRSVALAGILAVLPAAAAAQSSPAPAAPAAVDAQALARAKDLFHQLQTGTLDRSQLDDAANMNLDVDSVSSMSSQLAPLGAPQSFAQASIASQDGGTFYTYLVGFKNGTKVRFVYSIGADGKIGGLALQPGS